MKFKKKKPKFKKGDVIKNYKDSYLFIVKQLFFENWTGSYEWYVSFENLFDPSVEYQRDVESNFTLVQRP